ncbi:MAG: DUF4136 domain-containing protein [Rubrivivax sp.]|jgi:hypothetical protein|nr:DUF4136 domain-containing protein [Rubrivivax sp.]
MGPTATPATRRVIAAAATALLSGCAGDAYVRADADRAADFSSYRSFGFASPLGTDRDGVGTLASAHLRDAASGQLQARGLAYDAAAPQLLVDFRATVGDRIASPPPAVSIGIGIGSGGWGVGSGGWSVGGSIHSTWPLLVGSPASSAYQEGTLVVEMVDAARRQTVWQGQMTGPLVRRDDDARAAIADAVARIFEKFPLPRRGGAR